MTRTRTVAAPQQPNAHEQLAADGVAHGAGGLARILGPIFATTTLHYLPALPYLVCTAVLLVTAALFLPRMRDALPATSAAPAVPAS